MAVMDIHVRERERERERQRDREREREREREIDRDSLFTERWSHLKTNCKVILVEKNLQRTKQYELQKL